MTPQALKRFVAIGLLPIIATAQVSEQQKQNVDPDTVVLKPFEVNVQATGYRAANAITASRFALPIIDTPMSIQVVTEDFMKDIGARDQLSALSYVSGVTEGNSPVRLEGTNTFNIRGQSTSFSLRDGIQNYGINDGYNIERYEVLKGIVGMMYGSRNLGGVINAASKRPKDRPFTELFVRTDGYGSWRGQLDLNQPLNESKSLLLRVNAFKKDEGTFMNDERLRAHGVTTALSYAPFENTKVSVDYEVYSQDNILATKLPPLQWARGPRFAGDTVWNQRIGYAALPNDFNYSGSSTYLREFNRVLSGSVDQKVFDWLDFRSFASYSVRAQDRLNRDGGAVFTENGFATNSAAASTPIAPLNVFDFRTGTLTPATAEQVPFVTGINANLREFKNWDFIWRNDFLANYGLFGTSQRTLVGVELQERSGDFKAFDSYGAVTLDGRNPVAAAQQAVDSRGRVNVDLRTFDPRLPLPTREEILARRISDANDRFGNFNGSTNESRALYAVQYAQMFDKRLTVMAGLRQDRDRLKNNYSYDRNLSQRIYSVSGATTLASGIKQSWQVRNSPQAGIAYRVRNDFSVYATWSEVVVALNNRASNVWIDDLVNNAGTWSISKKTTSVDSQTGVHQEIGAKFDLLDANLSGTFAVFNTLLKNKPFFISRTDSGNITMPAGGTLAPFDYNVLAGEEESKGVELDLTWAIKPNWRILFSYAFTDSKVTKDSGTNTFDTDPAAGNQNLTVPFFQGYQKGNVPEHQAKVWSSYSFQGDGLLKGVNIGTGVRTYTESPSLGQFNTYNQISPAYTIVDLSVSRKFKMWGKDLSVVGRVNNALDESYISSRQMYGEPRSYILEARYRF